MQRFKPVLGIAMVVALAALGAGCGSKSSGKVETLAQVGDQKITTADLDQALENLPESYRAVAVTVKGKRQILDNLIKKSLLIQEATTRGFQKEDAVRARIKDFRAASQERLQRQIAELQGRLKTLDRQVYENVMLTELNDRLKKDALSLKQIADSDVQSYYEEYVNKLKQLNPAAVAPKLETVSDKIRAILVEEQLLKELEKKHKVAVEEERFQKRYAGDAKDEATIQDSTNP